MQFSSPFMFNGKSLYATNGVLTLCCLDICTHISSLLDTCMQHTISLQHSHKLLFYYIRAGSVSQPPFFIFYSLMWDTVIIIVPFATPGGPKTYRTGWMLIIYAVFFFTG